MKLSKYFILVSSLVITSLLKAQDKNENFNFEMYPKPESGYKQVYIQVPAEQNEANYKVELFIGFETMVDCNYHTIIGSIKEKNIEGWGYSYFQVESEGKMTSTLMGCLDQELSKKFIHMIPQLIPYNSKLPIVLNIPSNFIVKYKIFKATEVLFEAKTISENITPILPVLGKIDYVQLHNYFIKNTVKKVKTKITSQKEFDSYFGAATVMGINGKPTQIDFSKQFVIAVSKEATNYSTSIEVTGVALGSMGDVIVSYKVDKGTKQTYTLRPLTLLAIDKNNTGKVILKEIK